MHDEIIEYSIATNKIMGFRNMSNEMGFKQDAATKIYQDNGACIQVMKNRGSLSKHSRHIERRVLSARKIEDGETWPEYIHTSEMVGYGAICLKGKGRKRAAVVLHPWYWQNWESRMISVKAS
jgi:hypothetical protein